MNIQGPLVADGSLWDDHINAAELKAGGVVSWIMGLYKGKYNSTRKTYDLHPNCLRIIDQAVKGGLLLQGYYYYYPEYDPRSEADWLLQMRDYYDLPVKFMWVDAEDAKAAMSMLMRSEKYRQFTGYVKADFPNTGLYTNNNFIVTYAPAMKDWIGQYPQWVPHYGWQPAKEQLISWADFKAKWVPLPADSLDATDPLNGLDYNIILHPSQTNVVGHQFTGDIFHLPGVYSQYSWIPWWPYKGILPLDVSVFTPEFINSIGGNVPVPPPPVPVTKYKVVGVPNSVNVRYPYYNSPAIGTIAVGTIVTGDNIAPSNGYTHISAPKIGWVYSQYLEKIG